MHKLNVILLALIFLVSCGTSEDNKAQKYLDAAIKSFQEGNYTKAKTEIDSIKLLHPKAFNTRKAGIRFMLDIEQEEQTRGLMYLDSLEIAKIEELDAIKHKYLLEKNKEYQEIGYYIIPEQSIEKNLNRSYLRFQVSEKGIMSVTATYSGRKGLNLQTVKASTTDQLFTETPLSDNNFVSQNLGLTTEKSDFKRGKDGDLINFIIVNNDKNIQITYTGDSNHQFILTPTEKKAAKEVNKLAKILYTLTEIQKAREEAHLKIKFIESRKLINDSIDKAQQ